MLTRDRSEKFDVPQSRGVKTGQIAATPVKYEWMGPAWGIGREFP
ncbi:hypothetical protein ABIB38_002778 [Massilia sp. UYP11]